MIFLVNDTKIRFFETFSDMLYVSYKKRIKNGHTGISAGHERTPRSDYLFYRQ